ncbi:MAG: phosphate starvation-inducible protein PhoH, partial [Pseudomonadota bacterium]
MSIAADHRIEIAFDDNRLLPMLYGEHDRNLSRIEHQLGVTLASRGNRITVRGPREQSDQALLVLNSLWDRLQQGLP